jgi:hypothetical protein
MLMTDGLDEETVDFVPNYDDQLMQPGVMPAAYPNLLVNGASGSRSAWPRTWRRTTSSRSSAPPAISSATPRARWTT